MPNDRKSAQILRGDRIISLRDKRELVIKALRRQAEIDSPESKLVWAVIVQAIEDWFSHTPTSCSGGLEGKRIKEDAEEFLMTSRVETHALLVGLDPLYIHQTIQRALDLPERLH